MQLFPIVFTNPKKAITAAPSIVKMMPYAIQDRPALSNRRACVGWSRLPIDLARLRI